MANAKISALASATTPLAGTEVLPVVQGGITEQVSVANLTAGRDVSASGLFVNANSATAAVRITQLGAGNALLIEDSASPDNSPFVIDAAGITIQGYTSAISGYIDYAGNTRTPLFQQQGLSIASAGIATTNWGNTTFPSGLYLAKSRSGTVGTRGIVSSGDNMGAVLFEGDDGTNFIPSAAIFGQVDGTPSTNDMPGRLVFSTTADGASAPTERMRIDSAGFVGVGVTPAARLHLGGAITASSWTTNGISLRVAAATYTDSSTTASGTVASAGINAIAQPTIAATNATVTYTNAATVYIANSPANGTNVTVTNALSLWVDNGTTRLDGNVTFGGLKATQAAAPTIASAGTIAPTTQIAFVSGTTTISTITAPAPISAGGGQITLIPTGLWSTNTAGNIALATTGVVSKALIMTYDTTTAKWYPSY